MKSHTNSPMKPPVFELVLTLPVDACTPSNSIDRGFDAPKETVTVDAADPS